MRKYRTAIIMFLVFEVIAVWLKKTQNANYPDLQVQAGASYGIISRNTEVRIPREIRTNCKSELFA